MRRALPLALAALVVAGCGSQRAPGSAAAYAPRDAEAFVSFRTDANWQPFARLVLGRVPRVAKDAHDAAFALVRGKIVAVSTNGGSADSGCFCSIRRPPMPPGQRNSVSGRSRRCGSMSGAIATK